MPPTQGEPIDFAKACRERGDWWSSTGCISGQTQCDSLAGENDAFKGQTTAILNGEGDRNAKMAELHNLEGQHASTLVSLPGVMRSRGVEYQIQNCMLGAVMAIVMEAADHFEVDVSTVLTSAYRSFEDQALIRDSSPGCDTMKSGLQCTQTSGLPAGALDTSNHPSGLAIDFNLKIPGMLDWLTRKTLIGKSYAEAHGLVWFGTGDNVHFSINGT